VGIQVALTALPGAFNCSGSPVVSLPVGLAGGLPVGVSLVGRIGADYELLRVAAIVEEIAHFTAQPVLQA
jgi:Asp-tRNA(Asn)/Glu-tRNA(Gln) amidotransferase A subunit family amidase